MTNWERKSSYLLREIVKFRTYIDCLQAAQALREEIGRDRERDAADKSAAAAAAAGGGDPTTTTTATMTNEVGGADGDAGVVAGAD